MTEGKAIPLQAWTGPEGYRRLRLPDFKTFGISRWGSCQPYEPAALPQGHSATGRMSTKNASDNIGNRTRDLPACSAVPQPTAPPRAPEYDRSQPKAQFVSHNYITLN